MTVTIERVKVTPKKAKEWLECNTNNRTPREDLIERIRRDIVAGHWTDTTDPVKFNTKGELIDGQHRLSAVVKANRTITLHVASGVDDSVRAVIDTGVSRSARDVLVMAGHDYRNTHIIAAITRLLLTEPRLGFVDEKHRSATHSEVLEFVNENTERVQQAADLGAKFYRDLNLMPSVIGAFWMVASKNDPEGAHEFLTSMAERRLSGAGDPRLAFSKRLAELAREKARVPQYAYLSMIFRAWNAWKNGTPIHKVHVYGKTGALVPIPEEIA